MDYKCTFCQTIFDNLNEVIKHLKNIHKVKEKKNRIKCCVNRKSCPYYYFTFSGLRNHVKECIQNRCYDEDSLPKNNDTEIQTHTENVRIATTASDTNYLKPTHHIYFIEKYNFRLLLSMLRKNALSRIFHIMKSMYVSPQT